MSSQFDKAEAVIVTHYQGLTMQQLDDLRNRMREHGIQFKITKNRITKLATSKNKMQKSYLIYFQDQQLLHLSEDAITSAKILTKFSKENSKLKFLVV